uniref:Uncharacterized protein n=1 Tax=Oryza rufipogon TaxID=4529 RepID=A0A0E0QPM6_ORYRU
MHRSPLLSTVRSRRRVNLAVHVSRCAGPSMPLLFGCLDNEVDAGKAVLAASLPATKKPPWELYAFHRDVRVALNPDVKSVALRTPRLDAYSGQSLTIPSTSTTRRTLALGFTVQQVLSASKELIWTQMATLKPWEILRRKARHN